MMNRFAVLRLFIAGRIVVTTSSFAPVSRWSPPPTTCNAGIAATKDGSSSSSYLRWNKDNTDSFWKMQTAVTTFQRGNQMVELHAQLHFGDEDYFNFYNSADFDQKHDSVHYELLVDEQLLKFENGNWRLSSPIMASPNDQILAEHYGWNCQVSSIDYTNPKWVHADLTKQEFVKLSSDNKGYSSSQPLWQLASPQSSSAVAEAMSALFVGPPTLSYSTRFLKRRLFTNLFLPGDALANNLRALLWMTIPAPELSIILLDWSSLLKKGGSNPSALSEVALPILSSLTKLNVHSMRRFLFGQVLVSSATSSESDSWALLVTKRNDRALGVLTDNNTSTALLYGSSHCPELHTKLKQMGFQPKQTTWRTAWSVQETPDVNLPALVVLPILYLGVGDLDWIGMMGDVSQAWIDHRYVDVSAVAGLYLIRHTLLYLGLSKFLVDWKNNDSDNQRSFSLPPRKDLASPRRRRRRPPLRQPRPRLNICVSS
jgi:hypothetical protein